MEKRQIFKALEEIDTEWLTYGKFYVNRDHIIGFIPKVKWLKDYFKARKVGAIEAHLPTVHASKYNGGQMFSPLYVQQVLDAVMELSNNCEVFIRVQGLIFIETDIVCGVIPNRRFEPTSSLPVATDAFLGTETKIVDDGLMVQTKKIKKPSKKLPNRKLTRATATAKNKRR